jgi:hypothetical protein
MLTLVLRWPILAAIYLLLVGQASADEIALACACGALALGWSIALDHVARLRFRFSPAALKIVAQAVAGVPRAIIAVAPALLWRRSGSIRREPLARGGNTEVDAGWRAAALLAISLAPDRYALRWAKRGNAVEVHHLAMGSPPGEAP